MFIWRQQNASCSSGGNGTRGSQPARSERNAWSCSSGGLGRNRQWKRGLTYRKTEETDLLRSEQGPLDREGSGVLQNGRNGPPMVETGVLLIRRGVAYRKTEETDFSSTSYGQNRGPIHREGCGIPQNGTPLATIHPPSTSSLKPPQATVNPPSTSSSLHLRLFIHGVSLLPPPATIHPRAHVHPASAGYCSTTPPQAIVHPTLHQLLFNQPSTGSCSSSPPQGPVHPPARSIGVLFIQRQRPLLPRGPVHPTPHRELFIQTPQQHSLLVKRQHQSASVSSSSEGITRV